MLQVDAHTVSALITAGTAVSVDHMPEAAPRAALVFVAHRGSTSSSGITVPTYGGVGMALVQNRSNGTTPFPGAKVYLLDDVPEGLQTVAFAKNATTAVRVVVVTLLADGAVVVDDSDGGSGSNTGPQVPAMTATGPELAFALVSSAHDALPTDRDLTVLASVDDGTEVFELQYGAVSEGANTLGWVFADAQVNARSGLLLADPNPAFIGDFETGDLSQWGHVQALPDRLALVTDPVAEGTYAGSFEVQPGDIEPETEDARCEVVSTWSYGEGDEHYFRIRSRVELWDFASWGLIWQLHDDGDGSPPLGLFIDSGGTDGFVLQHGDGSVTYWEGPAVELGEAFEVVVRVVFSTTVGVVEVWHNGVKQTLVGGDQTIENANTLGLAPAYDKLGIYRSADATDAARVYHDGYRVTSEFFSDPPAEPAPDPVGTVSGGRTVDAHGREIVLVRRP